MTAINDVSCVFLSKHFVHIIDWDLIVFTTTWSSCCSMSWIVNTQIFLCVFKVRKFRNKLTFLFVSPSPNSIVSDHFFVEKCKYLLNLVSFHQKKMFILSLVSKVLYSIFQYFLCSHFPKIMIKTLFFRFISSRSYLHTYSFQMLSSRTKELIVVLTAWENKSL